MPTASHADADDQPEQLEEVRQADHREVRPELSVLAGGHVERDNARDEEDQEQRPEQLTDIRR